MVGTPSFGTIGVNTVSGVSTATCADGDPLISGGASITGTGNATAALQFSMPNPNSGTNPTGWQAQAVLIGGAGANTFTVTAYAICEVTS